MPLLPADPAPQIHLAAEIEAERPRPAIPSPPPAAPTRRGIRQEAVAGVIDITRSSWPMVAFHLLVLGGTIGYAANASAQPADGAGLSPEAISAAVGDPWASVVIAVIFVGGQAISAWREWSKVRGADLEKARTRIETLEGEAIERAKQIAKLEAERDLAQAREGDARAAASGSTLRPAAPPGE